MHRQLYVPHGTSLALQISVGASAKSPIADTDSVFICKWKYLKPIRRVAPDQLVLLTH